MLVQTIRAVFSDAEASPFEIELAVSKTMFRSSKDSGRCQQDKANLVIESLRTPVAGALFELRSQPLNILWPSVRS